MIPDEEPKAAAVPPSEPMPVKGPRRSRRGGRRHSRGPGRPSPPLQPAEPAESFRETPEPAGEIEPAPVQEPRSGGDSGQPVAAVSQAIEEVNLVIEELKRALDQMEEVLETLELAERQKIDDEREIDALQQALRKLRRPGPGGPPRH